MEDEDRAGLRFNRRGRCGTGGLPDREVFPRREPPPARPPGKGANTDSLRLGASREGLIVGAEGASTLNGPSTSPEYKNLLRKFQGLGILTEWVVE